MLMWFGASEVLECVRTFQMLSIEDRLFAPDAPMNLDGIITLERLDRLIDILAAIDLPVASKQCARLKEIAVNGGTTFDFGNAARGLVTTLEDELGLHVWLTVDSSNRRYMEPDLKTIFGSKVVSKFRSSAYDMVEACKCLAFGRSTASAHHLVKVVESALKRFVATQGVSVIKHNGAPKEWQTLITETRSRITAQTVLTPAERRKQQDQLIAIDRFENIKDVRHRTQHPDEKYTEEEASLMLGHVVAFLQQVAKLV
jgi:hypothetical protein